MKKIFFIIALVTSCLFAYNSTIFALNIELDKLLKGSDWIALYQSGSYETINREKQKIDTASLNKYEQYLLSRSYFNVKEYSESIRHLEALRKQLPPSNEWISLVYYQAFVSFLNKGNIEQAISSFHLAIEKQIPLPIVKIGITEISAAYQAEDAQYNRLLPLFDLVYKLFPRSMENDSTFLALYLKLLHNSNNETQVKQILLTIWETHSYQRAKEIIPIEIVDQFDEIGRSSSSASMLRHLNKQLKKKNYSYLEKKLPEILIKETLNNSESVDEIRKLYFRYLFKRRHFKKLKEILTNNKWQIKYQMTDNELLQNRFKLYYRQRYMTLAKHIWKKIKKLKDVDPFIVGGYAIKIATYYKNKGKYEESMEWYQKAWDQALSEDQKATVLWNRLFWFYKNGAWDKAAKEIRLAKKIVFTEPEVSAKFCYWGVKVDIQQDKKSLLRLNNQCKEKYPHTFYGILSDKLLASPYYVKKASYYNNDNISFYPGSSLNLSSKEKEKLTWMHLLYQLEERKIADAYVRSDINQEHTVEYFSALGEILLANKRFYLAQKIVSIHYRKKIKTVPYRENAIWEVFYPTAYKQIVEKFSKETGIPPLLALAVMKEESHFNSDAISVAGAIGLMQLMPQTALHMGRKLRMKKFSGRLVQPEINIKIGVHYLKFLAKRLDGNIFHVLAAYNGGLTNVRRWLGKKEGMENDEFTENIPFNETRNYVKKVIKSYEIYKMIYQNGN